MFSFHSYFPSFSERANSLPGVGVGGATLISAKGCHAFNDLENMFNFSNHA